MALDAAALLTALGVASLPSVALEVFRTVRLHRTEDRVAEQELRRAPVADAAFVVAAAREATDLQHAVLERLGVRIQAQEAEVQRLLAENRQVREENRSLRVRLAAFE